MRYASSNPEAYNSLTHHGHLTLQCAKQMANYEQGEGIAYLWAEIHDDGCFAMIAVRAKKHGGWQVNPDFLEILKEKSSEKPV